MQVMPAVGCKVTMNLKNMFKGWIGEKANQFVLSVFLNSQIYHCFQNVILHHSRGSSQIDQIVVSEFGVFVIEVKTFTGWIFGDAKQKKWTRTRYGNKYSFQNPLHQNYGHMMALSEVLAIDSSKMHSVILFLGSCEIKTEMPPNVVTVWNIVDHVKSKTTRLLPDSAVKTIASKMESLKSSQTVFTTLEHVENVKAKYSDRELCPKCGNKLVVRTARKTSEQFIGCSSYPKCRFTRSI